MYKLTTVTPMPPSGGGQDFVFRLCKDPCRHFGDLRSSNNQFKPGKAVFIRFPYAILFSY